MTILAVITIAAAGIWIVSLFNGLIGLRNQVTNAFKQIDVQLKRRYDLIPNLVNAVRGEMKFEQETLEKVMKARAGAMTASAGGNMAEMGMKEGLLSQALGRLLAVHENYPNLKANETVKKLMEELTHTENQVGFSRQFYNDLATKFNTRQQIFPNNFITAILGFSPSDLFEIPAAAAAEREAPKVDLTI
ncbi:MAG: LemA family protein [bacterium]